MELLLVRHLWGVNEPWEECFPRFRSAGYGAVEASLPEPAERERFFKLLAAHRLEYVSMIFTRGDTPEQNLHSFRSQIDEAMAFSPVLINCHSGQDAWSEADNLRFYEQVVAFEEKTRALVAHETHRK